MNIKDKRCLVTGGAGFIGSHLVDLLVKQGCKVRVLDDLCNGTLENLSLNKNNQSFEFMEGSVTEPKDIKTAIEGVEVVFHLACLGVRHSISQPYRNHKVNAEGTLLLLEAAKACGVEKFLYCSSSEIYGTAEYVPMPETHPARPCTVYGASKLAGEAYTRAYHKTYGMDTVIVRPFNTYGPRSHHEGDAGEMIPRSIVRALNGINPVVFGDGRQTRDFTYVTDTAEAILTAALIDRAVGKTLNIGSNFEISVKDLAEKIVGAVGNPELSVEYIEARPGDVLRLFADPSEFNKLTNWRPKIIFEDGLKETVKYFKDHPLGVENLIKDEEERNW